MPRAATVAGVSGSLSGRAEAVASGTAIRRGFRRVSVFVVFALAVLAGSAWSLYNIQYSDSLSPADAQRAAVVSGSPLH